jgi:hypothetical protein
LSLLISTIQRCRDTMDSNNDGKRLRPSSPLRAFCRRISGSAAVEFALTAPILILLTFAIIEFGRAWWAKNSLEYAVERAARYAVVCPSTCPSDAAIQTYAASQVYDQSISLDAFSVTHPASALCVNYSYTFTPWFGGQMAPMQAAMTLTGISCRNNS